MANKIDLQPEVIDLTLYAGDGISFKITCKDEALNPIDITGSVMAQIRVQRTAPDPPLQSFAVSMVDAYQGIVTLSLTGEQTAELSADPSSKQGKFTGVWDLQWSPASGEPRTLVQGKVECVIDVSR